MDVLGRGVDVGVSEQRLHDGEVDAGLGQGGAEGVAKRVRMSSGDLGLGAVIAKDAAKARSREGPAAVGARMSSGEPTWRRSLLGCRRAPGPCRSRS